MDIDARVHMDNILQRLQSLNDSKNVQSLFDRMKHYKTPGASITVIDDYKISWTAALGSRTFEQPKKKVTPNTVFQAGSISKAICTVCVLRLADKGILDLDEGIHRYLRTWTLPDVQGWTPRITIRQLLSHHASINVRSFPGYNHQSDLPSLNQILNGERVNSPAIKFRGFPGLQMRYSGGGLMIVQKLLEDILEKPFQEIVKEWVFDPLEMGSSFFDSVPPDRFLKNISHGYTWGYKPVKGGWKLYPESAAAGLWSTSKDLANFVIEMLKALEGEKPDFLSRERAREILVTRDGTPMGLAFFVKQLSGSLLIGHDGWNDGFVSRMMLLVDKGQGAVIMLNSNQGTNLLNEIENAIAEEYDWPSPLKDKVSSFVVPSNLMIYTGVYVGENGINVEICFDEERGMLLMSVNHSPKLPLTPLSAYHFQIKDMEVSVSFSCDRAHEVDALTLIQCGEDIRLVRNHYS
jgi:CubicO group peptidase (beta-lactamase class C family)